MLTNNYHGAATNYALREVVGTDMLAFRAVAERLRELQLGQVNTLDIGCGSGRSTRFLKALGLKVRGVDVSTSMIAEAQRLDSTGCYDIYSVNEPLPYKDQSFSMFFSSWVVLEQGNPTLLRKFMSEAARVFVPGG